MVSGGAVVVAVAAWVGVSYAGTPIPTDVSALALEQASTVYFNDGKTVVGTFGTVDRQVLSYNQIPAQLRNAVLAAEDRNFYNEGGISPTGIMRAAYDDVTGSGDALQGGSTITEQFVKNYYANVTSAQTISNKIKEIFIAVKLAREKSKAWILTQYLNTIYFGDGAYGVEAAAQTYFGKPVGKLDVAQDAMIASTLNAPGQFSPVPGAAGYSALVARWKYVLQGMVSMHNLSPQVAAAQSFPKVVSGQGASSGWTGYNGYIMQAVEYELESLYHYSLPEINNDGLRIVTTFSKPKMNALYATVAQEEHQMAEAGRDAALPSFAHLGAVLEQPGTGAIVAMYAGPSYSEPGKYCQRIHCQLNMALTNREQVGSSFKPYVLSAARAQGMSVKTSILDGTSPLCVPGDTFPQVYAVPATGAGQSGCPATPDGWHAFTNDEGDGATGPQTVVNATAQSLNTAYTDLTHRVGTQNVINMAKSFGVNTADYPNGSGLQASEGEVGIALGQNALTVGEQANTFATIANNGEYNTPHVIQQITKAGSVVASRVTHHEVLTPAEDSDVEYALSQTTISGTGTNAEMSDGRPMIGKTGTTSTAQSAFFLGAIPQYSLAVGIFTNQQNASTAANAQTLNNLGGLGGYGGDWPALIWHAYAQKEFLQLPVQQLPTPDFGGTAWNLMGPGQGNTNTHPHPHNTQPVHSHPTPTCTPSPLNNDCQGGGGGHTPPASSSPPASSTPPPSCNPDRPHCGPLAPQAADQSAAATTTAADNPADRARRIPVSRSG
jgi:membrane peptidoglycan carboxypeptidase